MTSELRPAVDKFVFALARHNCIRGLPISDTAYQAAAAVIEADREAVRAPLLAEIERLREDADRYRWLRDHSCPPHNFYVSVPDEFHGVRYSPGEVDTYIDQARATLAEGTKP